uniref:restriction endonuclease subunit S n=2 Tax=Thiolapillus sp. TaxID=2017437 RepID=UPI003AF9836E
MRSKSDKKKSLVPRLRFPEFREAGAWEVKRLGDVAALKNGYAFKSSKYSDNGAYKVVTIANVQAGHMSIEDMQRISPLPSDLQTHQKLSAGDILISMTGNVGRICYVLIDDCLLNQRVGKLVPTKIDKEFFYHSIQNGNFQTAMQERAKGGAQGNLSAKDILQHVIYYPNNKHEQQKIAHCLSSLDEVIGLQAKKVQALKQHKKGLMQQLFPAEGETTPRLRFPDFREAGAWEFIPLEAIAPLVNDRVQLKDISNVNYVSTENILQDFGGVAVANKLPTVNSVSSFQAGDVLLANIRPYLKKVWAANFSGGASNDVLVFRPRNSQGGQYVAHILKNNRFINYVMAGAKGVKMPRGDINSIKEYPVPIPPETTEQQKIAHCLSSLDEVIGLESHKLDALKNLKKGLMQQLFPQ